MTINIVMLGGLECGKTSALVGMFEQVVNGPVGEVLTIYDKTQYVGIENTLMSRRSKFKLSLESCANVFMMDGGCGMTIDNYTFGIRIPNERETLDMRFTDIPGSMFNSGRQTKELQPLANESDVIIIAINTPYLMECNERTAMAVNRIQEIREILSAACLDCQNVKSSKMVIFMPVKCEKWFKANKIDEVNNKVKSLYSSLIREMHCNRFISICIIPVQTLGGIEFMEMREAYNVVSNEGNFRIERCSKLSENVIRLQNGKCRVLKVGERLCFDSESIVVLPNIIKPNAWYRVSENSIQSPNKALYNPHNCEQILLHILRNYVAKVLSSYNKNFMYFYPPFDLGIAKKIMNNLMRNSNLIKNDIEGIEYVTMFKNGV